MGIKIDLFYADKFIINIEISLSYDIASFQHVSQSGKDSLSEDHSVLKVHETVVIQNLK